MATDDERGRDDPVTDPIAAPRAAASGSDWLSVPADWFDPEPEAGRLRSTLVKWRAQRGGRLGRDRLSAVADWLRGAKPVGRGVRRRCAGRLRVTERCRQGGDNAAHRPRPPTAPPRPDEQPQHRHKMDGK